MAGNGPDIVLGGAGSDSINAGSDQSRDFVIGDNGFALLDSAEVLFEIRTNEPSLGGNDIIITGDGPDIVFGGTGADSIDAGGTVNDEDVVLGDNGEAFFTANVLTLVQTTAPEYGGMDEIQTNNGFDVVLGGSDNDLIFAGGTDDSRDIVVGDNGKATFTVTGVLTEIMTLESQPVVYGGDDTITTGKGPDVALGGSGNDVIIGASADSLADVNATLALVSAGAFEVIPAGDNAADVLIGDNGLANFTDAGELVTIITTIENIGGNDILISGNGPDTILGGIADDTIVAGGDDNAEDRILGDNGRVTLGQTEPFAPGEEFAIISLNFNANDHDDDDWWDNDRNVTGTAGSPDAAIESSLPAPRADNWNNLHGKGYRTYGDDGHELVLFDDGEVAPGVTVSWGRNLDTDPDSLSTERHSQIYPGSDQDRRLFEGYLATSTSKTLGVDLDGLVDLFVEYDVYVYLDADNSDSKSGTSIRSVTDGSTTFYLDDPDDNTFDGTYVRATSTDSAAPDTGNYVVFTGLNQDSVNIRIDDFGSSSYNKPAITAIQVVGRAHPLDRFETRTAQYGGDDTISTGGGPDLVFGGSGADSIDTYGNAIHGASDADIVAGDNARATIALGEVRQIVTTDPQFGSNDIIHTGNGDDLVLGGNGSDTINTGIQGDFDYGDIQVISLNFNSSEDEGTVDGIAGAVAVGNWNNLSEDGHGHGHDDDQRSPVYDPGFADGTSADGVIVEWGYNLDSHPRDARDEAHSQIDPDTQNERLFEGYLTSSTSKTVGVDISGLSVHYPGGYDVYVYLDADDSDSKSGTSVRRITDGTTAYFLDDADGNTFRGTFVEVTSTDPNQPGVGNYVVFRDLTSDVVSIRIDNDNTLSSSSHNLPAITGIQIVGGADKDNVVISGDFDRDLVVGDNAIVNRVAGQVYELVTTDVAQVTDGVQADTILTGAQGDIVLGGNGNDSINGQGGDDIILGDNARIVLNNGTIVGLDLSDSYNGADDDDDDDHYHHGSFDAFDVFGIQLLAPSIGGADTLEGGTDDDLIYGQFGADVFEFSGLGLGHDQLVEIGDYEDGPNDLHDRLDFSTFGGKVKIDLGKSNKRTINSGSFQSAKNLQITLSSKSAFEHVIGSPHDDDIEGNRRDNTLDGRGGDDTLDGDDGRDILIGGPGGDYLGGDDGQDILINGSYLGTTVDLNQIQTIWAGAGTYSERVSALTDSATPWLDTTQPGGSVLHDMVKDILDGDDGLDLFFAELDIDRIVGRRHHHDDDDDDDDDDHHGGNNREVVIDQGTGSGSGVPDPNTASLSGFVWVDANGDGVIDMGEQAIEGVVMELYNANGLVATTTTDSQGLYSFNDLSAGIYTIVEQQPAGFADGTAVTNNGGVPGVNTISDIPLDMTEVLTNFNFGEQAPEGTTIQSGQTATIGFWYSKAGKKLIKAMNGSWFATSLGNYLAATFPNMFGSFAGMRNYQIKKEYVSLYKERVINSGNSEQTKLELEVFSLALSSYVTNRSLVEVNVWTGNADSYLVNKVESHGFLVSTGGVGAETYDLSKWVDTPYAEEDIRNTFGLSETDSLTMSILDLLKATDSQSGNLLNGLLYDDDNDGLSVVDRILRDIANSVFSDINASGSA